MIVSLNEWKQDILVSVNEGDEEFRAVLDSLGVPYEDDMSLSDGALGKTFLLDTNQIIVRVSASDEKELVNILTHEVFHAVSLFLDNRGVKLKVFTSCEIYAYAIGYIMEEVWDYAKGRI